MKTVIAVRDEGLVADFYQPSLSGKRPGVIVIGGAGGGFGGTPIVGSLLAEWGYATLALAYFGLEPLPARLEEIPLEYFERAIKWMQANPLVEPSRIGFMGTSKGGEGALLVSATYPNIRVVIAYSPSHVIFQSVGYDWSEKTAAKSSWTFGGKPRPFVPYRLDWDLIERYGFFLGLYLASLQNHEAVERAIIPVERISGPVLLISGKKDAIWPSSMMCDRVIERLRQRHFSFAFQHISYAYAGHLLAGPGRLVPPRLRDKEQELNLGATESANAAARDDAWAKVREFLSVHLA